MLMGLRFLWWGSAVCSDVCSGVSAGRPPAGLSPAVLRLPLAVRRAPATGACRPFAWASWAHGIGNTVLVRNARSFSRAHRPAFEVPFSRGVGGTPEGIRLDWQAHSRSYFLDTFTHGQICAFCQRVPQAMRGLTSNFTFTPGRICAHDPPREACSLRFVALFQRGSRSGQSGCSWEVNASNLTSNSSTSSRVQ